MSSQQPEQHFNEGQQNRDLNQYWYSDHTIKTFVSEIRKFASPESGAKVAFLSTPSIYFAFPEADRKNYKLFEFDTKWDKDPGFVFYDFNHPEKLPVSLWGSFDYLVVDPPFITKEVWENYITAVTTLGKSTPAKDGVEATHNFKVLFTTVIENHNTLEELLDQALFVPDFRPTVVNLVYQYSCFINYPHDSGPDGVTNLNPEIPAEDSSVSAARRMANDMRESQVEFHAQMRNRRREGEQRLPAPKVVDTNTAGGCGVGQQNAAASSTAETNLENVPISAMKWGSIPEGLQVYKDGAEAPPEQAEIPAEAYGPAYVAALKQRECLEAFKKAVDVAFKKLDVVVINNNGEGGVNNTEAQNTAKAEAIAAMREHMQMCASLAEQYEALAKSVAATPSPKDAGCVKMLQEFVSRVTHDEGGIMTNPSSKMTKDWALDATRKYKSPAFLRQKELLQAMKDEKKKFAAAQKANEAAATTEGQ